MRSRPGPKTRWPSFDPRCEHHRTIAADRPTSRVKIRSLVFCASLFGFGCTVRARPSPPIPPITAATADQRIDRPLGGVVLAGAAPVLPAANGANDGRKLAPTLYPPPPRKVYASANARKFTSRPRRSRRAPQTSRIATIPPAQKRNDGAREHHPRSSGIAIAPAPLTDSGDLALVIVEDESGEGPAVQASAEAAAASNSRSLSGTFTGTSFRYAQGQTFLTEITFTIVGTGKSVTGTWSSAQGTSGKLDGTIEGSAIRRLRLEQYGPCSGTYVGLAIVVRERSMLDGSYAGADCEGEVDGSFVVRAH